MSDGNRGISNRAALVAVITAFLVGMIGTLAVRPPGQSAAPATQGEEQVAATRIRWRVPLVFQTTIPVLGDNPVYVAEIIKRASGGAVKLELFEPGEIVPAFSITDAVRDGKIEAGYTWLGYDQGKIPASPLVSAVPFGMEPWEYSAWWYVGGGQQLTENLYRRYNLHPVMCGLTGPETAGWFRNQIISLDDVEGLKIRFAGLGGRVIERLGASVTMIPGGEIFQALEKVPSMPANLPCRWWINPWASTALLSTTIILVGISPSPRRTWWSTLRFGTPSQNQTKHCSRPAAPLP